MYKRIIIKIGTGVISKKGGKLNPRILKLLVDQCAEIRKSGIDVIIVTSGAVGTGRGLITIEDGTDSVVKKQVYAAVGQVKLMSIYAKYFAKHGIFCAQILATKEDFRDKEHYQNMKNCMENLLRDNVIPVVNENDAVAVAELVFTDNDELSGLIAQQLNVDGVILLTSVDGVFAGNPKDKNAKVISEIQYSDIASFEKYLMPDKTEFGRGGMPMKFKVAKELAEKRITTHIANGLTPGVLSDILKGKSVGTKFLPLKE
ncbi:glutamate 5-kinase [Candidatus Kaiserbacteria bacterium RIFCSPHIGHO2_02_FULL_49_16]|uniref:Glutamate 5-kinase n=1 Tax=Candidatus Kaiserbacteria bacterium RIFCSPHIGHO2_02_FULL_49_16 TaxID=1798490 RepID=A0A1F6DCT1_9BACT|nr:MAG: glutamate 5-kinase [Candidatus Kaiserbacteria bacterium RIFCSPHIGHO2_02_FULL_49_16]